MKILDILQQLEGTSSRLAKEAILQNNDSPLLRTVCHFAVDPFITFGIKKIPDYDPSGGCRPLADCLNDLLLFESRELTGNAAAAKLLDLLEECDQPEVIDRVVSKDLRCGVSIGTLNRVFEPDFVSKYPVMLATAQSEKSLAKIKYPALVQTKHDGTRVNAICENGKVTYFSRNGREFCFQNQKLAFTLHQLEVNYGFPIMVDGELISITEKGKMIERKTSNGIANKAVKGTISEEEGNTFAMFAWDCLPLSEWKKESCSQKYSDRFITLDSRINNNITSRGALVISPTEYVNNVEEAFEFTKKKISNGEEGSILKNLDSLWENKRSQHLVKIKQLPDDCRNYEADLKIIGIKEGRKKYTGMIGSIEMESSCGNLKVSVGTGLSDEQRGEMNIIGKIATVNYQEIITSEGRDHKSLFLPVLVEIREDKDVADSLAELESK